MTDSRRNALPDRQKKIHCGAAILSGGLNSRMAGQNKAFLDVGGHSILSRLLTRLQPFFQDILLVTRQPRSYSNFPVQVVIDLYEDRSSLTGIHAGLVHANSDYLFVVPCDTPFLQPLVIRLLLDTLRSDLDIVVPFMEGHYQPLCAIYSKRCIPFIEKQLRSGDFKIINFFDRVTVETLSIDQIKAADPQLRSFFNVNTPSAHLSCRDMLFKTSSSRA